MFAIDAHIIGTVALIDRLEHDVYQYNSRVLEDLHFHYIALLYTIDC